MESWQYLQPVVEVLIPRVARQDLASLSESERIVYLVWCYLGAIDNGGHSSFFYNSCGQFAAETASALHKLGAAEYAQILGEAVGQFPGRIVPRDIDERNNVFNSLPHHAHAVMEECDNQFYALGDQPLMEQLLAYSRACTV